MKDSNGSIDQRATTECPSIRSGDGLCVEFSPPESACLPRWIALRTVVGARKDTPDYLEEVVKRAFPDLSSDALDRICLSRQVHGNRLERVGEKSGTSEGSSRTLRMGECDGLWTSLAGTCLLVRTADCAPIGIWDRRAARLALVHSGWRGTLGNIVGEALKALYAAGTQPEDVALWIGPMICGGHFEVGDEVRKAFAEKWPDWSMHWQGNGMDLEGMIRRQAMMGGVAPEAIFSADRCTFAEAPHLPSHRRQGSHRLTTLFTVAVLRKECHGK